MSGSLGGNQIIQLHDQFVEDLKIKGFIHHRVTSRPPRSKKPSELSLGTFSYPTFLWKGSTVMKRFLPSSRTDS